MKKAQNLPLRRSCFFCRGKGLRWGGVLCQLTVMLLCDDYNLCKILQELGGGRGLFPVGTSRTVGRRSATEMGFEGAHQARVVVVKEGRWSAPAPRGPESTRCVCGEGCVVTRC